MKSSLLVGVALVGGLVSCNQAPEVEEVIAPEPVAEFDYDGELLMQNNCLTCHGNGDSHETILAPPMRGVKMHYLEDGMSEEEFVTAIVDWVKDPKEENTRMPGAVKRFNVMPKQNFNEDEVRAIASYMYNNDMPKPNWFDKHMEEEHGEE